MMAMEPSSLEDRLVASAQIDDLSRRNPRPTGPRQKTGIVRPRWTRVRVNLRDEGCVHGSEWLKIYNAQMAHNVLDTCVPIVKASPDRHGFSEHASFRSQPEKLACMRNPATHLGSAGAEDHYVLNGPEW